MKKFFLLIYVLYIIVCFASCNGISTDPVTKTTDGWTRVVDSPDTETYYISASDGDDINNDGLGPDTPVQTLAAGFKLLKQRTGYPDHLLLKAGDTWNEVFPNWADGPSGRNHNEPVLVSSYGSGKRPTIKVVTETPGVSKFGTEEKKHIFFIGLDFYDSERDPSAIDYDATCADEATGVFWLDDTDDILFEDCSFRFLSFGLAVQRNTTPNQPIKNLTLRRCVITDCYARNEKMSSGYYFEGIEHLVVEENIFDHNGWNLEAGGNASMFNHNTYTFECKDVIFRGNLLMRAASLSAKFRSDHTGGSDGAVIEDNFLFESEVGISIGGNEPGVPLRFCNVNIRNNVFLQIDRDNPTNRGLGWSLEGQDLNNAIIANNLFIDQPYYEGNNYAIQFSSISNKDVLVRNNIMYHLTSYNMQVDVKDSSQWNNVQIANNAFQSAGLSAILISHQGAFDNVTYSSNTYNSSHANWASINDTVMSYADWLSTSRETGSLEKQVTYPHPNRTLESYQQSLTGGSLNDFMAQIRMQSKYNWRKEYTAAVVNAYFRSGFNMNTSRFPEH